MPSLARVHSVSRSTVLLVGALVLGACHTEPTEPPATPNVAVADPGGPSQTIELEQGFQGTPLRSAELSADAVLVTFADGEGEAAVEGKRVAFLFSGYNAATGERVMGTQDWPATLVVGAAPSSPVEVVVQEALTGLRPGAQVRVEIPAMVANATRREHEAKLGDLWLTLTVTEVDDPPQPRGMEAYSGEPLSTTTRRDGLEIHEYAQGEGIEARDGDRVEFHYVVTSLEGERMLDTHASLTPVELVLASNSGVPGLAAGLRGSRVGTLRKLVVPAELGFDEHAPEQFPRGVPLVIYVEVTRVDPAPDREF